MWHKALDKYLNPEMYRDDLYFSEPRYSYASPYKEHSFYSYPYRRF